MYKIKAYYILLIFTLLTIPPLFGQHSTNNDIITIKGTVIDSLENRPIQGVLVCAVFTSDTLYTTTGANGSFELQTPVQPQSLEFLRLGYGISRIFTTMASPIQDYGPIHLDLKTYAIDEVVVKARIKQVVYRGDTVQFNAAAFKVLDGATAGDLLSKMPGMDVDKKSGTVEYAGERIEQAYVDGKKIFGGGTSNLLELLEAYDVKSIDLYDELNERDKKSGNMDGPKKKVLNFTTYSQFNRFGAIRLLAGYGSDEHKNENGKRQERYAAGGSLRYFAVGKHISADILGNNIDRRTNLIDEITDSPQLQEGYNRINIANINGSLTKQNWSVKAQYAFEKEYKRSFMRTERIYTPTEDYLSRAYNDSTISTTSAYIHNLSLGGYIQTKKNVLYLQLSTSIDDRWYDNLRNTTNMKDDNLLSAQHSSRKNNKNDVQGDYMLNWDHNINPKSSIRTNADFSFNNNQDNELQQDSTQQGGSSSQTFLTTNNEEKNTKVNIQSIFSYSFPPRTTLSAGINLNQTNNNKKKISIDEFTGLISPGQSYDYEDRSETFSPNLSASYRQKNHEISFSWNNQFSWQQQNNALSPVSRKLFFAPLFSLNYRVNGLLDKRVSKLMFTYATQSLIPGANMLNQTINNNNPSLLTGGNPNLKQTYTHRANVILSWMENEQSFSFSLQGTYTKNRIERGYTTFFDQETVLPEYNGFIAPAGSSLSVYTNIKDYLNSRFTMQYSSPIHCISSKLNASTALVYNYNPAYIGTELINSNQYASSLRLEIISNFSEFFEFAINSVTAYSITQRSNESQNSSLNEGLQTSLKTLLLKNKLTMTLFYDARFYKNFEYKENNTTSHLVNVTTGYRFLKNRGAQVGFSIYDLFNKSKNFRSNVTAEYLYNSWSVVPGRYAMINFSYQFNIKTK